MAYYSLIEAYMNDLAHSMRWHRNVDDILAETDDHLRCAVERGVSNGLDADTAQREVLGRFGDAAVVARSFASARNGRLALPTDSTRSAGVLAYVSAGIWIAFPGVWHLGGWLYDRLGDSGPADEIGSPAQLVLVVTMAMTLLGAAGTLLITTLVLRERHGGFGLPGMAGIAATGLGTAAALFGWFYIGWGSLLIFGTALLGVELWRQGVAPKGAALVIGVGLSIGGLAWGVLRFIEVGSADQYGEYAIANAAGLIVGPIMLASGLIGIGRWLSNEEPVELPRAITSTTAPSYGK